MATELEKIFANHISNKGLLRRIYKEHSKLKTNKETKKPKQTHQIIQLENEQNT